MTHTWLPVRVGSSFCAYQQKHSMPQMLDRNRRFSDIGNMLVRGVNGLELGTPLIVPLGKRSRWRNEVPYSLVYPHGLSRSIMTRYSIIWNPIAVFASWKQLPTCFMLIRETSDCGSSHNLDASSYRGGPVGSMPSTTAHKIARVTSLHNVDNHMT